MNSGWRAKVHYKMVQGGWYDLFEAKPFEFDMAYDVVLPPNQHFDIIEFEMDSIGALNQTYRNKGLHKFTKCCFTLTEDDLWEIVKNSGVNTEASLEIKLEWSDSLSDFRIRITSFTLAPPKTGIKFRSRTIYVNPYTKAWQWSARTVLCYLLWRAALALCSLAWRPETSRSCMIFSSLILPLVISYLKA